MLQNKLQHLKKKAEGFTIIEVMIVLVIAAVIILIVFLAVPALQRNSRNNQRKNDVARVSAAVTEALNNSNGTFPSSPTYAFVSSYTGDLAFYDLPTDTTSIPSGATTTAINENTIEIRQSSTCTGTNANTAGGTSRQFTVRYAVETGGSDVSQQCIEG
jgi:prepilin-type N-terminal cleavage/methylation domain-containing protein